MKTIKQKTVYIFLMFYALAMSVHGQQPEHLLTFDQAMQIMLARNPALLRQKEEIRQKEYEIKSAKGLRLPKISLNATATAMSDPLHLDLTPVSKAITPLYQTLGSYGVFSGVPNPDPATNLLSPFFSDEMSTEIVRRQLLDAGEKIKKHDWDEIIQEKNFALVTASFALPIYAGNKINGANHAARVNLNVSRQKLRHCEGILLAELVSRYYGLALGIQIVKLREEMLNSMENHYEDAKKLFNNGMIAKVELLHAEVAKKEAERELKEARRKLEILRTGLKATLASDSPEKIIPVNKLFINKELTGLTSWFNRVNVFNPQLKQIHEKKELVEIKHSVEKNEYLPTIAAMGYYNVADKNFSPYMPDWQVGIGMKWTLFEGMSRRNNLRASKTMYNQVEYAEQKASNDLEAYLVKLFHELQIHMEQKTELETTLQLANEYRLSTENAFKEGFATSTNVVEANTKVLQVKAKRLSVLYGYDVTLAHYLQTAGIPEQYTTFSKGENTVTESL